jgi:hypothetical protein
MKRPDRESRRMLLEALETVRELRAYLRPKAGVVHRVKVLLRKSGVPIASPRRPGDTLARAAITALREAMRGELLSEEELDDALRVPVARRSD